MAVLKVKAVAASSEVKWAGFYGLRRRKDGDVFILRKEEDFSHRWMEAIGWTPKAISSVRKESFKEIIRQAPAAIDVRKDMEKKAKTMVGQRPVTVEEPVPATVKEVNIDDTSHNQPIDAI